MKNHKFMLVIAIIAILLVGFTIIAKNLTPIYNSIEFKDIENVSEGLIYVGNVDKQVDKLFDEYKKKLPLYNMSEENISNMNDILNEYNVKELETSGYILISNNVPVWSTEDISESELNEAIDEYFYGIIPDSKIAYKVPKDGDSMVKLIKGDVLTVLVIGKEDCNYCTMYLPIVNEIASKYDLDIYYIDVNNYKADEYKKITDLGLDIPAKCTTNNVATDTTKSFAKPMTLILAKGRTVDCMLGYQSYSKLESKLYNYGLIDLE